MGLDPQGAVEREVKRPSLSITRRQPLAPPHSHPNPRKSALFSHFIKLAVYLEKGDQADCQQVPRPISLDSRCDPPPWYASDIVPRSKGADMKQRGLEKSRPSKY